MNHGIGEKSDASKVYSYSFPKVTLRSYSKGLHPVDLALGLALLLSWAL